MFASVLIANRGEIACRIARSAKRLGLRTIAVYSQADADALHVRACDEAHLIGPAQAAESYLRTDRILDAARASGADCIHPGYGFLSENPEFAEACGAAGVVFVGPSPEAIRAMGLKDRAKTLMEQAGVPVVPGYHGERQEAKFLKEKAYEIGYPVAIKAVAGGGGKGLRRVDRHADFDAALESVMREAIAAFGDDRVLIEKYVSAPRHIEFQVFADRFGKTIHLHERDCSLQRRHQKVIEEAPAPGMSGDLRAQMGAAAVAAARAVGYVGAGTVEFIVDSARGLRRAGFWFLEMNTRLQVEHPVTEAVTGLDLVEWQLRVAAGEPLPIDDAPLHGHAVEARIYAEDPEHGFLPSPGTLVAAEWPEELRIDAGVETGSRITPDYDPMLAKLIAHAPTREQAFAKLACGLRRTLLAGPRTNLAFLSRLCDAAAIRAGTFDTGFIDAHLAELGAVPQESDWAAAALGVERLVALSVGPRADEAASPWDATDGFQLSGPRRAEIPIVVDGEPATASLSYPAGQPLVTVNGASAAPDARAVPHADTVLVIRHGRQTVVRLKDHGAIDIEHLDAGGAVLAPMHGKVLALFKAPGDVVLKGERLAIVEAMKMEHTLTAPADGRITEVAVAVGAQVAQGGVVMRIEELG
jgi:3-methylcrotonyl-CoA carboxylase alpha subunit